MGLLAFSKDYAKAAYQNSWRFTSPMIRLITIESQQSTLLVLLGKTDEAIVIADEVTAQLHAPVDGYMNFSYLSIYNATNDREAYREWVNRTLQIQDQLPPLSEPFIEMHLGQLVIWAAILKVFPANAYAKLLSAKVHLAEDNEQAGREALAEALEIWSGADADYVYSVESRSLLNSL